MLFFVLFRYHPFYITSSPEGGYGQKTQSEQARQQVYAGVEFEDDGYPRPTAAGRYYWLFTIFFWWFTTIFRRYCEWQHNTIDKSEDIETFEDYMKTLKLECDSGEPAYLNWTVADDTPDTVYYQVKI